MKIQKCVAWAFYMNLVSFKKDFSFALHFALPDDLICFQNEK